MAASTGEYIPIITSKKLPDMPGRIIAQMASAPAPKNASCEGATSLAGSVVTHQANTILAEGGSSRNGEKRRTWGPTCHTEATIRPQKKLQFRIGWLFSGQVVRDARLATL